MNSFLILLLCSVACCVASFECYDTEREKCDFPSPKDMQSEAGMEKFCKSIKCSMDAYKRCGEDDRITWLGLTRLSSLFCDKSNPMREKLIQNLQCIYQSYSNGEEKECRSRFVAIDPRETCSMVRKTIDCLSNLVHQRCGKDARDAYVAFHAAMLECR